MLRCARRRYFQLNAIGTSRVPSSLTPNPSSHGWCETVISGGVSVRKRVPVGSPSVFVAFAPHDVRALHGARPPWRGARLVARPRYAEPACPPVTSASWRHSARAERRRPGGRRTRRGHGERQTWRRARHPRTRRVAARGARPFGGSGRAAPRSDELGGQHAALTPEGHHAGTTPLQLPGPDAPTPVRKKGGGRVRPARSHPPTASDGASHQSAVDGRARRRHTTTWAALFCQARSVVSRVRPRTPSPAGNRRTAPERSGGRSHPAGRSRCAATGRWSRSRAR